MAGYGTTLSVPSKANELARILLLASQSWAEEMECPRPPRVSFRKGRAARGRTEWDWSVDGNSWWIAAWVRRIERDLPTVADGYRGAVQGLQARRVAKSLVTRFITSLIGDVEDEDSTRVISYRDDDCMLIWPMFEFADHVPALRQRQMQADDLVAWWLLRELPTETVIEDIHTVAEALLRYVTKRARKCDWPCLIEAALDAEIITPSDSASLATFSTTIRNPLKHRGATIDSAHEDTYRDAVIKVLAVIEKVARQLPG